MLAEDGLIAINVSLIVKERLWNIFITISEKSSLSSNWIVFHKSVIISAMKSWIEYKFFLIYKGVPFIE